VDLQGGQQARRAVTQGLVLVASRAARGNRPGRPGAAARRHAGLVVHTQHQGVGRRDQLQPTDVSRSFPQAGSLGRVIQLRTRWGLISRSARMRPIWEAEMPMSASSPASWEWLQWLAGSGLLGHGGHDPQPGGGPAACGR
jgi:hypothetical protein